MDTTPFLRPDGLLDLARVRVDPGLAFNLPASFAARRAILPLSAIGGEAWAAMADPGDSAAIDLLSQRAALPVSVLPADRADILRHVQTVYGDLRAGDEASPFAAGASGTGADPGDDAVLAVENILRAAVLRRASDVHVDPERDGVRVRMRVDGVLEDFQRLPSEALPALVSRVKILARLDIAERRAPQDGAFTWRRPFRAGALGGTYDVRVATLPIRFGERVTLRLLETDGARLTLDALGMDDRQRAAFERVLARPHGLVLLTGPTGSGKTTTLYAAIRHLLDNAPLNILTVEDPVEYEIAGVAQCEVDSTDKVSFGDALRSLLRHDPDVIMIGEIRDSESLDIAVKAALTGHLVLSTLHTNDSVSAVLRLADMGLEPHLAAATLRLSVAQRLVRRLCPVCSKPVAVTAAEARFLGRPELAGRTAYVPGACLACAGRGYAGRIGLFEFMVPDEEISAAIAASLSYGALRDILFRKGFRVLLDDALAKSDTGAIALRDIIA
ncbi:MAG: type II/IV secretion system protein [Kiritimatiellae bacterium]|nr:type II/IV secretion system protein [Kiritimatiellia bacterium]